jgi:HPt (histidine-containing phosphotransfer) domain-containing protein
METSVSTAERAELATRVAAPPIVPAERPIDLEHLARMTFGEPKLEREVLELFDRQATVLLARMSGEAPKVMGALAHTLAGSARAIGAWQVAEAASALEQLAENPGPDVLAPAFGRVTRAVADVQAAIADMLRAA